MKKLFYIVSVFLIWSILFLCFIDQVQAAKKEKSTTSSQALKILSNDGESVIYGSILNPKADEANILLTDQYFTKVRKTGLKNLSVNLVSALDSTKTYSISQDAVILQKKKIGKKAGRYLVVSIFNLTSTSGITVSPSALPAGNYRLRITGSDLNLTTDTFSYQTPALIVGTVDSKTSGLVSIEDLDGDKLSDRTVATNPNGSFFTEVRASKITGSTKARKYLRAQVSDSDTTGGAITREEEIDTCVIHATTDKDLLAVAPLSTDTDYNAGVTNDPIVVNENSTLTANLAIASAQEGDEELAFEIAQAELEDIQSEGEEEGEVPFGEEFDIGCDIEQFANQCSGNKESLASLGKAFKTWIVTADCRFPEFKLLQKILPKLPDFANAEIGAGYCEHATREVDDRKPCEIYAGILREYKEGRIQQLVCPPYHCDEFKNIRPPKCFEPEVFCEEMEPMHGGPGPMFATSAKGPQKPFAGPPGNYVESPRQCIRRPMEDLFCAKIPDKISAEKCSDKGFRGPKEFSPGWVIETDLQGNQYCVPSNFPPQPQMPPGFMGPKPPSNSKEAVGECSVKACHDKCAEKYGHGGPQFSGPIPPIPTATVAVPPAGTSEGVRGGVRGQTFGGFDPKPMPPYTPPKCEECDCHFACDADAGRVVDCGNPSSKYFSNKCCNQNFGFGPGMPPVLYTHTKEQFFGSGSSSSSSAPPPAFSGPSFPPGRPPGKGPLPITHDLIVKCLCSDIQNNFNEKGFVKEDRQELCRNTCPDGYEKASGFHDCLQICPQGLVRDPGGICRKNCPPGQNENEFGVCSCPPGLIPDPKNPKQCISSGPCPQYCYNYPAFRKLLASHDLGGFGGGYGGYQPPTTGPGYIPPGSNSLPPECQRCTGDGGPANCQQGYKLDPTTKQCVPVPVTTCPGNMYPNPNSAPGAANCLCPSGLPYWDDRAQQCAAVCPGGNPPATASANMPPGSPIPCGSGSTECPQGHRLDPGTRQCIPMTTCSSNMYPNPNPVSGAASCLCPSGLPYWDDRARQCVAACPGGNPPATASANMPPGSPIPCGSGSAECPSTNPYRCTDGRCVAAAGDCTAQNYCSPGIAIGTNGCTCNLTGGSYHSNGYCTCSPGSTYTKETGCSGGTTTQCSGTTPIRCPDNTCAATQLSCPCPTATPYRCSDGTCAASSTTCPGGGNNNYCAPGIQSGTNGCTCNLAGGSYNSNGYCTCSPGSTYTKETGCTSSNPSGCTSPQVINPGTNACACPPGMYRDPNNSSSCLACAACTISGQVPTPNVYDSCSCSCSQGQVLNGPQCCTPCTGSKVFSGATCACSCPAGQTEDASGNCVTSQTAPSAPSNLQTTSVTATQVALSWTDNSNNENGFKVSRKPANDPDTSWSVIATLGPNATTYVDTANITTGSSYSYRVNSYNGAGNSPDSNTITATIP